MNGADEAALPVGRSTVDATAANGHAGHEKVACEWHLLRRSAVSEGWYADA